MITLCARALGDVWGQQEVACSRTLATHPGAVALLANSATWSRGQRYLLPLHPNPSSRLTECHCTHCDSQAHHYYDEIQSHTVISILYATHFPIIYA